MISKIYHEGEVAVQEMAHGRDMAERVGFGIQPYLFDYVVRALPEQDFFVASIADDNGNLWALPLIGEPGFATALDADTLLIRTAEMNNGDMLRHIQPGKAIGLIGIVFTNRIRVRINGVVQSMEPQGITVTVSQAYGNCPKYIQRRAVELLSDEVPQDVKQFTALSAVHRQWIEAADTFFIGSGHPQAGLDASHRGGNPGFIRVEGNRITFPDYAGNMMFNTLGNITANPNTGLLFIDFEGDRILQLTGQAQVHYDDAQQNEFVGALRLVTFDVIQGREVCGSLGRRWNLLQLSPYNPQ